MRSITIAFALALLVPSAARAETLLERGDYLMRSIVACGNCHTPQTPNGPAPGMELAGQLVIQEEAFTAYAPNITQDKETGIGTWTDVQIIAAIREGRRPDGSMLFTIDRFALTASAASRHPAVEAKAEEKPRASRG